MSLGRVDVVIVGSGPAGLACAYALSGMDVLILERESRYGGRVLTIDLAGQSVDMGACYAFNRSSVPAGLSIDAGRLVRERAKLGIWRNGTVHLGATPLDCLKSMHLESDVLRQVIRFSRSDAEATRSCGPDAYALLDGCLHQIHPGELAEYDVSHQRDGLYTWYPDHWERGNQALVEALFTWSGARLLLDAEVRHVVERRDAVEVSYHAAGDLRQVTCSAAVIAATADVAASLLPSGERRCRRLLQATRYAGFVVVGFAGVNAANIAEFRCLVCPGRRVAAVVQQRSLDRSRALLLCYYRGSLVREVDVGTDDELVALTRGELAALGFDREALGPAVETAVKRWPVAGTILSPEYRACRSGPCERVSERVYLAGDYVSVGQGIGYGVADALASGADAGRRVRMALNR